MVVAVMVVALVGVVLAALAHILCGGRGGG